jgi:four helix bundle protein
MSSFVNLEIVGKEGEMQNQKENIILKLTFEFALMIIEYTELLEKQKKFQVANQLIKSGTSIGANVREAQNAESKADFIHKMKISAKEADETEYWLMPFKASENYPFNENLNDKLKNIILILSKIIGTTKRSIN